MRIKMAAVLMVVTMSLTAGNAAAAKGGDKGMMNCQCREGKENGTPMPGEGRADHFLKMVEMLELNAEQSKAVEAIHFAHHKEVIRKEADIEVAEVELQEIMAKNTVNLEEAETQIRAIAVLRADLEVMHLKTKEAVKAKLSPKQLEKMKMHLAAAREERLADMGGMGRADCKMAGKAKKCEMLKDDAAGAKAKSAGKKAGHGHQH
ncbi:MAG: hypothetical protein HGA96_11145 [Desulfobulbaceae bacterium]|nr:hypothetical protein [Desulfobulbaceae bacterium]